MSTTVAEMMLRCVFDGCIPVHDMNIERRPYHKNCSCALHKLKGFCSSVCSQENNISFPKKQSWADCSISLSGSSKLPSKPSRHGDSSTLRNKEDVKGTLSYR